jgi:hypothetical protein
MLATSRGVLLSQASRRVRTPRAVEPRAFVKARFGD